MLDNEEGGLMGRNLPCLGAFCPMRNFIEEIVGLGRELV
jgi:hypothetical protein